MSDSTFAAELERHGPGAGGILTPREARAYCRRLAESHYENFTVTGWLAPRKLRPHLCHIYAYCRWADDLADEIGDATRSRELLDWWEGELDDCYRGRARHPVFIALRETIEEFAIPRAPFADLLVAFRRDQIVTRYESREVLSIAATRRIQSAGWCCIWQGALTTSVRLSDSICSGLQLANFCQDVARDWDLGRVYLPQQTLRAAGFDEKSREIMPAFRQAVAAEVAVAEELLRAGEPLVGLMPRAMRAPVWLFAQGGLAIVAAIRRQDYDVWTRRPVVGRATKCRLLAGAAWRRMCGTLGGESA